MDKKIYSQEEYDEKVSRVLLDVKKFVESKMYEVNIFSKKMNSYLNCNKIVMFYANKATKYDDNLLAKKQIIVKIIDDVGALKDLNALKENMSTTFQRAILEMDAIDKEDVLRDAFGYAGNDISKIIDEAIKSGKEEISVIGIGDDTQIKKDIRDKAYRPWKKS